MCIDINGLDDELRDACCGHIGYDACKQHESHNECPLNGHTKEPHRLLSDYLAYESIHNITLSDASVFNCNALPHCEMTCSGPSEAILLRSTHECGCVAEWGIHAAILRTLLVVVVFTVMNISRFIVILSFCTRALTT